jgi:hypothetical protein
VISKLAVKSEFFWETRNNYTNIKSSLPKAPSGFMNDGANHLNEQERFSIRDSFQIEQGETSSIHEVPDGGLEAWMQVAGAFFQFFNTWGLINAFGTFQTYYQSAFPDQSASNISWIGSIDAFLLLSAGVITGPLLDLGYFRVLVTVGSVLVVLGIMMTSLSTEYWQVMLSQGVCFGLGCGCLYVPSLSVAATYFHAKRSVALGIITAGSGFGAVIYSIIFYRLEPRIGFPGATRVLGYIALGTLAFGACVMRPRIRPKSRRAGFLLRALKEKPFASITAGIFLGYMGTYVPIDYVASYTRYKLSANPDLTFYIVPILSAASIFGRIIPPFIGDYVGPINVLIPIMFCCGFLTLVWIAIRNIPGMIVFAVLFGFCSGGFVALAAPSVAGLTKDLHQIGSRMGTCFFFGAFGILIGSPVAGALVQNTPPVYWKAQVFAGVLSLASTGAVAAASYTSNHNGWTLRFKNHQVFFSFAKIKHSS